MSYVNSFKSLQIPLLVFKLHMFIQKRVYEWITVL